MEALVSQIKSQYEEDIHAFDSLSARESAAIVDVILTYLINPAKTAEFQESLGALSGQVK